MEKKFTLEQIVTLRLLPDRAVIGEQTFESDETKAFFKFTLLHSFPFINSNGHTFALPLLAKYVHTAKYQPLSKDHQFEGNPDSIYNGSDQVMGTMLAVHIPGIEEFGGDIPLFPDEPVPVEVIGVLWKRKKIVRDMLEDIAEGIEWRVSMEVIRDIERDVLLTGDKVIGRDDDVYEQAIADWQQHKFYDGKPIGLALGGTGLGEKDYANFWGSTMTLRPADQRARITQLVAAVASTGKITAREEQDMAKKIEFKSDGTVDSSSLAINGEDVGEVESFYISGDKYGNDEYFNVSWTKVHRDGDAVETRSFRFDPETSSIMEDDMNIQEEVKKALASFEEKYKNWVPKEELDSAVQAAKDQYKDYISPEDVQARIDAAVQKALDERDQADRKIAERESKLEAENLVLTAERKARIREFGEADDAAFENWLIELKNGLTAMKSELETKKIQVNDAILSQIARCDGVNDPVFQAIVATAEGIGRKSYSPIFGGSLESEAGETKEYVH